MIDFLEKRLEEIEIIKKGIFIKVFIKALLEEVTIKEMVAFSVFINNISENNNHLIKFITNKIYNSLYYFEVSFFNKKLIFFKKNILIKWYIRRAIKKDMELISYIIQNVYYKNNYEEYFGKEQKENKNNEDTILEPPAGVTVALLIKETSLRIEDIEEMTPRQVFTLLDSIIYNENEKTEDGKKRNRNTKRHKEKINDVLQKYNMIYNEDRYKNVVF